MNERRFPPPPPRPQINHAQPAEIKSNQEPPSLDVQEQKKLNWRLLFLIIGSVISFIGATVCGYFLFG